MVSDILVSIGLGSGLLSLIRFSKPMLSYSQLDLLEHISVKFDLKVRWFHLSKYIGNWCLQNLPVLSLPQCVYFYWAMPRFLWKTMLSSLQMNWRYSSYAHWPLPMLLVSKTQAREVFYFHIIFVSHVSCVFCVCWHASCHNIDSTRMSLETVEYSTSSYCTPARVNMITALGEW